MDGVARGAARAGFHADADGFLRATRTAGVRLLVPAWPDTSARFPRIDPGHQEAKRGRMKTGIAILAALVVLVAVALLPLPIRPYLDFQVLYHADLGLRRGIALYDHAGQVDMIAQLAHVPPEQVFVLPFPYPPWFALSTLWLAWLPIDVAARVWFGLNLIMLVLSVWLLIGGRVSAKRVPLYCLAIIWAPVLGSLFVGQYVFPVLLGAALMAYSLRSERAILTGCAAALLTFKPHLGGLIIVMALVYLWLRRDRFGHGAVRAIIAAGAVLFGIGFLASPNWPLDYFRSLTGFRDVSQCHQCVSPSMAVAGVAGGGLNQAVWVSAVLAIGVGLWLVRNWRNFTADADQLVTAGVLATFLVSPYLQNYDYLLLLAPFLILSREARGLDWVWIAVAFTVPLAALALLGPAGNGWLVLSTLLLFGLEVRNVARQAPGVIPA